MVSYGGRAVTPATPQTVPVLFLALPGLELEDLTEEGTGGGLGSGVSPFHLSEITPGKVLNNH